MANKVQRLFTGLAGLPVCPEPHRELTKLYGRCLRRLKKLPDNYPYRIATEQIISERKAIVESTPNPEDIEKKIGAGICEELMEQVKHEIYLIEQLEKHKPWEPLVEKPSQDQWKWPPS